MRSRLQGQPPLGWNSPISRCAALRRCSILLSLAFFPVAERLKACSHPLVHVPVPGKTEEIALDARKVIVASPLAVRDDATTAIRDRAMRVPLRSYLPLFQRQRSATPVAVPAAAHRAPHEIDPAMALVRLSGFLIRLFGRAATHT